jgi:hypothetical protein
MSEIFRAIPDWRQAKKVDYSLHDALMSGFACMHFQDPSLLQFQIRMQEDQHRNNLRSLFEVENIPKETQMREILDGINSEYFRTIFKDYYLRLQREKHLEQYQMMEGLYYFPIDGSQFYSSKELCCEQCLTKKHKDDSKTYSHQVLQGGIMHPDQSEVIPFMPEQICNEDGKEKQDCEMNAAKRLISRLRKEFPKLGLIIGGDALFSRQPLIEDIKANGMHYIFGAKPTDHKYLVEWLDAYDKLHSLVFTDDKGRKHLYEWMSDVPLSGREEAIKVNFFRCTITGQNKKGVTKVLYRNSWVTDLPISESTIKELVRGGRCRWKNENECFNVMKNHGYYMERNYGHGKKNLCFNFYLLTLLAFFFHQIFELTDRQYQACRKKFGSKKHLWEKLRGFIDLIVFDTWETLLFFALIPKAGLLACKDGELFLAKDPPD